MKSVYQLSSLPYVHRPDVKAFYCNSDLIWAGCRLGLYRIESGKANFLACWDGKEIMAIGPSGEGVIVAWKKDGIWTISRCNKDGIPFSSVLPPAGDEPTCVFDMKNTLWMGGKNNLYRYCANIWESCLSQELAGQIDWIRGDYERLEVAVLKTKIDGYPRILESNDNGINWKILWTGQQNDRIRAVVDGRIICKWTGDQTKPSLLSKPIMAVTCFNDWRIAKIQESTLIVADKNRSELYRFQHDVFSRALYIANHCGRIIIAGEQGIYSVDMANNIIADMTESTSDDIKFVGRIKHIWNIGENRFIACATYGTFVTADRGNTWLSISGALDILHVRRMFRSPEGKVFLATRDGIFSSSDGGIIWESLNWNGNGLEYDKLSGIAVLCQKIVWGGKRGLFIQKIGEQLSCKLKSIGDERIEEIVPDGDRQLLVLCHGGSVFSLDIISETTQLTARFPFPDGRTLIRDNDRLLVFGRKNIQQYRDGVYSRIETPEDGNLYSFALGNRHVLAFDESRAWIAQIADFKWNPVKEWPENMGKPEAVMAPDGSYAIFTDCHRLWRINFTTDK